MYQWKTDEYKPTSVNWFNGDDLTDYDDVKQQRDIAIYQSKIFGITLNSKSFVNKKYYTYPVAL